MCGQFRVEWMVLERSLLYTYSFADFPEFDFARLINWQVEPIMRLKQMTANVLKIVFFFT